MLRLLLIVAVFLMFGQEIPYDKARDLHRDTLLQINKWTDMQLQLEPMIQIEQQVYKAKDDH